MANAKFAILGKENSGKTSLISKAHGKINSNGLELALTYTDKGQSYTQNQFQIKVDSQAFLDVEIIDYSGQVLKERDENAEAFCKIEESIYTANVIYILIDGELLTGKYKDTKLKNVKRNCARTIVPYLSNYAENNDDLPLIIFVVTKAMLYINDTSNEEIFEILKESFSSVFSEKNTLYILSFDTEKSISVKIPILLGSYCILCEECKRKRERLQLENNSLQQRIAENRSSLSKESEKFFSSRKKMNAYEEQIAKDTARIQNNLQLFDAILQSTVPIWNGLANELDKNRNYLISGFDELLSLIPTTQTKETISFKAILINALSFIGFTYLNTFVPITSLIGTFLYAKSKRFIMAIALCIANITNIIVPDKLPFVDEVLQILVIIFFAFKDDFMEGFREESDEGE